MDVVSKSYKYLLLDILTYLLSHKLVLATTFTSFHNSRMFRSLKALWAITLFLFFVLSRAEPTCTDIVIPVTISAMNAEISELLVEALPIPEPLGTLMNSVFSFTVPVQGTYDISARYCEPEVLSNLARTHYNFWSIAPLTLITTVSSFGLTHQDLELIVFRVWGWPSRRELWRG